MTMIVTALSDVSVVQVVDRRITKNGTLYDDLANKAICGVCADARFSVAYTGLMMTPKRTDEWLVDFLTGERILGHPFPLILEAIRTALTSEFEKFRHLSPDNRRLTLAFAGFGKPGPFAATVTNQEDDQRKVLDCPADRFRISMELRNNARMRKLDIIFHGAEAAINKELLRAMAKIRRALFGKTGNRIASALVAVIRRAAKHPTHGHLTSPNCISMAHSVASGEISCDDHFLGQRRKKHLPHFVSPLASFKHVWIQGSPDDNI